MNYRDLLNEYIDLPMLSLPPIAGEQGGCMSSYDRLSSYDPEIDAYLNWNANDDGSGCVSQNGDGSIVAFEHEGPGCIFRTWSALPKQGHIRVYIDHSSVPIIDIPFLDFFEAQPNDIPPLNLSELSLRLSRGRNCWIPIPFQHHCRIELCEGWGAYYHFTYRQYPAETQMPPYTDRFTRDGMIALSELDMHLYDREGCFDGVDFSDIRTVLAPSAVHTVYIASGNGALDCLRILQRAFGKDRDIALEKLILRLYWDGQERPAVEAPLGAFFGSASGIYPYSALPMSVHREALECRFYMPYANGMKMEIVNTTSIVISFHAELHTVPCVDADKRLRFHAKWHQGFMGNMDEKDFAPGGQRFPDWPILLTQGNGRFCGMHLTIENTWDEPQAPAESWWYGKWDHKNIDWWWGEGDEKFFVDGEKFPSTFGTGSEDYFGYAWAAEPPFAKFQSAYACMNRMPIDGNGIASVCRFQIADNVPFTTSFEAFIEKYKQNIWEDKNCCLYSCVPYWYQQADSIDSYPSI